MNETEEAMTSLAGVAWQHVLVILYPSTNHLHAL